MKKLYHIFWLLICAQISAQELPKVYINDTIPLRLSHLKISIEIVGNTATSKYDMEFHNATEETLEGELKFPLARGQSVLQFSMEVNGRLRDAVIVEKEKARVAFESTVRQQIDPALLERTEGNNYSARIYPILPKVNKRVVITTEQNLANKGEQLKLIIPLIGKSKLDLLEIRIVGYDKAELFEIHSNYKNLKIEPNSSGFEASTVVKNKLADSDIAIIKKITSGATRVATYQNYFYSTINLTPSTRIKNNPEKILLLWDTSYSMRYRDVDKELRLLDEYFKYLEHIEVELMFFGSNYQKPVNYKISDSKWKSLREALATTIYDGGTSLPVLPEELINIDEILVFSDGIYNLGENIRSYEKITYTINSIASANHSRLVNLSRENGGSYINLKQDKVIEGLKILKSQPYQYLGYLSSAAISQVYPNTRINVERDFSLGGKFENNSNIKLLFGYENAVTDTISFDIVSNMGSKFVKRLWAQKKLKNLERRGRENRKEIIKLAMDNHLITEYTSMLILDRLEDYVRYKIEPPAELRKDYKVMLAQIEEDEKYKTEDIIERKEEILEGYEKLLGWYGTNFPLKDAKKKVIDSVGESANITAQNDNSENILVQDISNEQSIEANKPEGQVLDNTKNIITGTILDQSNIPLPGVNVIIKGTTTGTQTDFDGNFRLNAENGENLEISFLGFHSKNLQISGTNNIKIVLEEDTAELNEVVVMAYSASNVSKVLSGSVAGITVTGTAGSSSNTISVRGTTSINSNSEPLYILDGEIVSNPTMNLQPEEMESIQILKGSSATKLYGSKAVNGLVILTTKAGMQFNIEKVNKLNDDISEKIELKGWNPNRPYIKILEETDNAEKVYLKYLEIRDNYSNIPAFYLDISEYFNSLKREDIAFKVLTNLAEIDLNNYELLRAMAYRLDAMKKTGIAVCIYKKILDMRPEDIQSYRDLALAYERDGQSQLAFDLLHQIVSGSLSDKDPEDRFQGITDIAMVELNHILVMQGDKISKPNDYKNLGKALEIDIRVVIDWNHNDTDIDLWVTGPDNEKVFYDNQISKLGGHLSKDMIEGFGPEEFMIRDAQKGSYLIEADYYAEDMQKISGPTILKATIYTNYGRENESIEIKVFTLGQEDDEFKIATIII